MFMDEQPSIRKACTSALITHVDLLDPNELLEMFDRADTIGRKLLLRIVSKLRKWDRLGLHSGPGRKHSPACCGHRRDVVANFSDRMGFNLPTKAQYERILTGYEAGKKALPDDTANYLGEMVSELPKVLSCNRKK